MEKIITKFLNKSYPLTNGYLVINEQQLDPNKIMLEVIQVFGRTHLDVTFILNWLYSIFPDKIVKYKNLDNENNCLYEVTYHNNGVERIYKCKFQDGDWFINTYDEHRNHIKYEDSDNSYWEKTYNEYCKELTFKHSNGSWRERTYDVRGNQTSYKDNTGVHSQRTYDINGKELFYKDCVTGYWSERTWNHKGYLLTFKDSTGFSKEFSL